MQQLELTGLILAGGRGRRMSGRDKGLIEFEGQALIDYSIAQLARVCDQIFINCNRNFARYRHKGYPLIREHRTDFPGPFLALGEMLPQLQRLCPSHSYIILPCDTPGTSASMINALLSAHHDHPDKWIYLATPSHDHPLHSIIPASLIAQVQELASGGERRIMRAIESLPHHRVEISENLQINLNSL